MSVNGKVRDLLIQFIPYLIAVVVTFGVAWGAVESKVEFVVDRYQRLEQALDRLNQEVTSLRIEVARLRVELERTNSARSYRKGN